MREYRFGRPDVNTPPEMRLQLHEGRHLFAHWVLSDKSENVAGVKKEVPVVYAIIGSNFEDAERYEKEERVKTGRKFRIIWLNIEDPYIMEEYGPEVRFRHHGMQDDHVPHDIGN
jgi:hypothetical protein